MKFIGCAIVIPIRSRRIILTGLAITSAILAWNLLGIAFGLFARQLN